MGLCVGPPLRPRKAGMHEGCVILEEGKEEQQEGGGEDKRRKLMKTRIVPGLGTKKIES